MITENQLNEAIAEMQGQRNPNVSTCLKLASYYTIKDKMFPKEQPPTIDTGYSYAPAPVVERTTIEYVSDTDFGKSVEGKEISVVMKKLDEVMTGLFVINPPLYRRILRELADI